MGIKLVRMKKPLDRVAGITDLAGRQERAFSAGYPLTLHQFNSLVKEVLEEGFPESYWLIAEVSKVTERGHCYLELVDKDATGIHAQARATIWSNKYRRIAQYFTEKTGQPLRQGLKILF